MVCERLCHSRDWTSLDTLWTHFGHTLDTLWTHFGHTSDTLWTHFGHTLDTLWTHIWHTHYDCWYGGDSISSSSWEMRDERWESRAYPPAGSRGTIASHRNSSHLRLSLKGHSFLRHSWDTVFWDIVVTQFSYCWFWKKKYIMMMMRAAEIAR